MFKKSFSTLPELLVETVNRKSEASQARTQMDTSEVEPSYEVFRSSCEKIAAAFQDMGFSFMKSGPSMVRKANGIKYIVFFQTSYNNIPGKHVQLSLGANVRTLKLKKWRAQQKDPFTTDDWVAGGLVHLLGGDSAFVEWDLASKEHRDKIIEEIIAHIHSSIIPYFDLFSNPNELISMLEKTDIPEFDISSAVEFALCFGSFESAKKILSRYVSEHPELVADVKRFIQEFSEKGKPNHYINHYAGKIAWMIYFYGIDIGIM